MISMIQWMGYFNTIDNAVSDICFRIRGIEKHSDEIVIVGIDQHTLNKLDLFNLPPFYHVKLIENLYSAGAKAVLLDIPFSQIDSSLAITLSKYDKTIIACKQIIGDEISLPIEELRSHNQLAFIDIEPDSDGFIRRAQLFADETGSALGPNYSYALRAAMFAIDADTAWVDTKKHRAYVGDRVIPLDENNNMVINYSMDEQTFQDRVGYISYEKVIDNSDNGIGALCENDTFKGKVVLVGAALPYSRDMAATPFYFGTGFFSSKPVPMYFVNVHKNIADTMIMNKFITPIFQFWITFVIIVLMSVISVVMKYKYRGFAGPILSILLIIIYLFTGVLLFVTMRTLIPFTAPIMAPVLVIIAINQIFSKLLEKEVEKRTRELHESLKVLRDTQSQLVQSTKMASLGELVAGIAHEINTPLGVINSNNDMIKRYVKELNPIKEDEEYVTKIVEKLHVSAMSSKSILNIVNSLRVFARLDEAEHQTAAVHELMDNTLVIMENKLKRGITIKKDYHYKDPIECFPSQLNQVFINVINNAYDAMDGKGTIYISITEAIESVVITICDTGHGIPEDILPNIFDPGFTTKGVGVGTGLGLSICYRIVIEKHRGIMRAKNRAVGGACLHIELPKKGAL
ncbi:CHASE2 domain-containing protein [Candidatus Latescibacterota bacterium]